MTDIAEFERRIMRSLGQKVHARLERADEARINPNAFGDPEQIAEAMVAALPLGHVFDEISGPFYDTAGVSRWLGISRQALHQKVKGHAILACPLDDGTLAYPTWQFLDNGATIPSLPGVLSMLSEGTTDAWMTALWMRAPSDNLDGRSPSEWLREGRDALLVISMARGVAGTWRQ